LTFASENQYDAELLEKDGTFRERTGMAAEQNGTAAVMEEIVSSCTKCKQALAHTVVSKVKQRVAKVKCNTCGTIHRYLDPARPIKPKTPRKPAAQIAQEATYEKLLAMTANQKGLPYSLSGAFKEHDVIEHTTFGRGVVTHLLPGNKIHVAFAQGEKLLVCRR
jgi:hypothetical protein